MKIGDVVFFAKLSLLAFFFANVNLKATSLDGTSTLVFKPQHHVFSNGESAQGFVRMGGGFTIKPGAKATLDTVISVSGAIDLRETGIMQLVKDLELDSGLTWSSGGYINGRGNAIILSGSLSIPASKIIYVNSDTIIDGKGSSLLLNDHAQIFVENNATLTLRNLIIQNTKCNAHNPCLKVAGSRSKLVLDNVKLEMPNDIIFSQGQLYIYNDVIFSGTSAFIYTSVAPCYITSSAMLMFDVGTTFSFAPASTILDLFVLQDKTSTLYLNGCTLKTTASGMRLTRGNLVFDNKVSVESNSGGTIQLSSLSPLTSADYGTAINNALEWHPSGKFIAIGGSGPTSGNEFQVYSFNGSTLSLIDSKDFGAGNFTLSWHPSGNFISIGGSGPTSGNELQVYSFNGSALTLIASKDFGTYVGSMSWNPSGTVLAIGGTGAAAVGDFANANVLRLYRFDGSTLTGFTSVNYGTNARAIDWHPSGSILAVGGEGTTNELQIYSFDGSTLTSLTSADWGTVGGSHIHGMEWNQDGRFLAITGATPTSGNELQVYSFNGSTLTLVASVDFGAAGSDLRTISWHPSGTELAIGGDTPTSGNELQIYSFNGSALTLVDSKDYGSQVAQVDWNPEGNVLAIGGTTPTNPSGGFSNTHELRLYSTNFVKSSAPQALSRSINLGNSALGSDYDLNVEVFGGAYVVLDGQIVDDSA